MKKLIASLLLIAASLCYAAPKQLPDGSILFSPQDVKKLQLLIQRDMQAAYKAGAMEALEVLKSNPKLCPKDI